MSYMFLLKCFILAQNKSLNNFECATIFEVLRFVSYLKVKSDLCRNNITKYEDTSETFALSAIRNRGKHLLFGFLLDNIAHLVNIHLLLLCYIHKIFCRSYDFLLNRVRRVKSAGFHATTVELH